MLNFSRYVSHSEGPEQILVVVCVSIGDVTAICGHGGSL